MLSLKNALAVKDHFFHFGTVEDNVDKAIC